MMIIYLIISLFSASAQGEAFSLYNLLNEMSCDTYPYETDPSPVVQMSNGQRPKITYYDNAILRGNVNDTTYTWNFKGKCECADSTKNLTYSEKFYHY
jgi:hypothetical protein